MKHPVNARIKQIMEGMNKSPHAFSTDVLGYSHSETIRGIVNDERPASFKVLQRILEKIPNINSTWLYNGEGSMFTTSVQEPEVNYSNPLDAEKENKILKKSLDLAYDRIEDLERLLRECKEKLSQ